MNQQEKDEQAAKLDVQRAIARLREIQSARTTQNPECLPPGASLAKADMQQYCGDFHSIVGCTLVLRFGATHWDAVSYAPGFDPTGREGVISTFFARPYGSVGIAVDSFIANGGSWKADFSRMVKAECACKMSHK